jgi:hypothetical protein
MPVSLRLGGSRQDGESVPSMLADTISFEKLILQGPNIASLTPGFIKILFLVCH